MELIPFSYGDATVRVVERDGGPWFVASDIAKVLGFASAKDFVRGLDTDDRGRQILPTPSGDQEMTIISEAGLYSAILRSRVESAKLFKRWITHEVIPTIRKTGSYGQPRELTYDELMSKALQAADAKVKELEAANAEQGTQIKELTPKANAWERFVSTTGDLSASEAAKALARAGHKIGGLHKLYELCDRRREDGGLGWFFRNGHGQREAYQRVVDQGLVRMKPGSYENSRTGEHVATITPRFTTKALDAIAKHIGGAA